jgi:hypothetical protein
MSRRLYGAIRLRLAQTKEGCPTSRDLPDSRPRRVLDGSSATGAELAGGPSCSADTAKGVPVTRIRFPRRNLTAPSLPGSLGFPVTSSSSLIETVRAADRRIRDSERYFSSAVFDAGYPISF